MAWTTDSAAPACTAATPAPRGDSDAWRHPDAVVETEPGPPREDGYPTTLRVRRCPHCLREERAG